MVNKTIQIYNDFFYLSRSLDTVLKASELDHSPIPHENNFGFLMGYPHCCCKKIASLGEYNIDAYESKLIQEPFREEFVLINPSKYRLGSSFIAHVPCSTQCTSSLEIAKKLANFLYANRGFSILDHWIRELDLIKYQSETTLTAL